MELECKMEFLLVHMAMLKTHNALIIFLSHVCLIQSVDAPSLVYVSASTHEVLTYPLMAYFQPMIS